MAAQDTSWWRFYPWFVAGSLVMVTVVDGGLTYVAVKTFPGVAVKHSFDSSNHYDNVLAADERQKALGWTVDMTVRDGHPLLLLRDAAGKPIDGARIEAQAQRPASAESDMLLRFRAIAPGSFLADAALPAAGQWDILINVLAAGHPYRATRRVLVP